MKSSSIFNSAEQALLDAAPMQFPIIRAASAALKRCHTCGHGGVNINTMLRSAAAHYAEDKAFKEYLKSLGIILPVTVGGILIGDINEH